ncbi:CbiX/SirB N-terminal domain-containing protein [Jatrophihabitans sp.]|uniref:sirohydrochlorin chelatase n=1 Tax=Jatrophihabitans sp. TaxID=1932789 RepID=UPI0030C6947B|nr:sirohydrochlorin cobaltochelatase [Jatrophihabitans sp.]
MTPTLLLAAHGTESPAGSATTRELVAAIAAARPGLDVQLCFLDVATPSLATALDGLPGDVVVVPLLLSAGYHVATDIPAVVAGRPNVRVAGHLGPDPLIIAAVADRLLAARGSQTPVSTAFAAIASSRSSAWGEVNEAVAALSLAVGRDVTLLPLGSGAATTLATLPAPVEVAVYLLAEGTFLGELQASAGTALVAAPIGVHPLLVSLVLARYDTAVGP